MANKKQPYHDQIDSLCSELGITEKPYSEKTTIAELEQIIDDLEAQTADASDVIEVSQPQSIHENATDEGDVSAVAKQDEATDEGIVSTVAKSEDTQSTCADLTVKALKTFIAINHGERITVTKNEVTQISEADALAAIKAGVAELVE